MADPVVSIFLNIQITNLNESHNGGRTGKPQTQLHRPKGEALKSQEMLYFGRFAVAPQISVSTANALNKAGD